MTPVICEGAICQSIDDVAAITGNHLTLGFSYNPKRREIEFEDLPPASAVMHSGAK